jgi:hypothetical protein
MGIDSLSCGLGYTMFTRKRALHVRFEVFTALTMKNGVFWDATQCGSCKNRRSGGTCAYIIRVTRISELGKTLAVTSNRRKLGRLFVTAKVCPS